MVVEEDRGTDGKAEGLLGPGAFEEVAAWMECKVMRSEFVTREYGTFDLWVGVGGSFLGMFKETPSLRCPRWLLP